MDECGGSGYWVAMFWLFEKIKRCRMALVDWSQNNFGNTKQKLQDKQQQQLVELVNLNSGQNVTRIREVKQEISKLLLQEELFWRQRSRSIWLPARDKNTIFSTAGKSAET